MNAAGSRRPKQWKAAEGKTRFYLDGRCQSGPDRLNFLISLSLLVLLCGLFEIWVGPWLVKKLTPGYGIFLLVVHIVLFIFALASFLTTAFIDPGIVPRNTHLRNELDKNPFSRPPDTSPVVINGHKMKLKWCETCSVYRPPRTSHCSICNNCVRRFDHHCPWIGNCIGERNYSSFLWFVFSVTILAFYSVGLCVAHITYLSLTSNESGFLKFLDALGTAPLSMIIALLATVVLGLVSTLCGLHCYLLWINQTTNEMLKRSFTKKTNPFWVGRIMYGIRMLFPVRWPRYHEWSKPVEPYSQLDSMESGNAANRGGPPEIKVV